MKFLVSTLFLVLSFAAVAQDGKWSTLSIRTSSVCDMCETTIEKELIYEKGVKSVDLDLSTNLVKVEYDARKTTPEAIKVALTKLGYYADELPGDATAFANLPACCQKEGCGKMPEKKE
jgi:periplasmic mercuric ion binding protein